MKATCKDCTERFLGCHSTCKQYANFMAENEERKNEIYKRRKEEGYFLSQKEKYIRRMRREEMEKRVGRGE